MDKVIFDTNAYRYLVTNRNISEIEAIITKLKSKEKKNNIETLLSPIVGKELLAHVADKNDPSYEKCFKAAKAMYLHCSEKDKYNMMASPELLVSKAFFGKEIPSKIETNKAIGQILFHLATNYKPSTLRHLQRNLNLIRDHVLDAENNFAIQMKSFVNSVDPSATGWRIFEHDEIGRKRVLKHIRSHQTSLEIALGFLFIVYLLLLQSGEIKPYKPEELIKMSEEFVKVFPEPIALQKVVFENLVNRVY